jgi:lysophospholipase L1-like esterase
MQELQREATFCWRIGALFSPLDSHAKWQTTRIRRCYAAARRSLEATAMRGDFWVFKGLAAGLALLTAPSLGAAHQSPAAGLSDLAVTPEDRLSEPWWAARHKAVLAEVASHPDAELLVIGDSITQNYERSDPPNEVFQPTWRTFYAPRGALNLGFGGDTTSNLLWRLQNGEVQGLNPKAVVLMIGTNDTGHAELSADRAGRGIDAVVAELKLRLPKTKILLVGILPSGISDAKTVADRAVNRHLAAVYAADPQVTYLDIGSAFQTPTGALNTALYYDPLRPQPGPPLHPNTAGQRRMAEAIEPTLAKLLGEAGEGR